MWILFLPALWFLFTGTFRSWSCWLLSPYVRLFKTRMTTFATAATMMVSVVSMTAAMVVITVALAIMMIAMLMVKPEMVTARVVMAPTVPMVDMTDGELAFQASTPRWQLRPGDNEPIACILQLQVPRYFFLRFDILFWMRNRHNSITSCEMISKGHQAYFASISLIWIIRKSTFYCNNAINQSLWPFYIPTSPEYHWRIGYD